MAHKKEMTAKKAASVSSAVFYKIFRLFVLIGISYVVLYPILTMILQSITLPTDLFSSSRVWIPDNPTFTNFTHCLKYFKYGEHVWITVQIAAISTLCQVAVSSLVGYGLARYRFKGNTLVFMMVILTIIVPVQTAQIPMYVDYQKFDFFGIGKVIGWFTGTPLTVNLLNTKWVYYIPAMLGVGINSGLYIFLFRQFFKGMPKDLEDAGRVDGCNALQVYLRIMVPNTKPVFVTVALLSAIFYWNDSVISGMFLNITENMPIMLYTEFIMDPSYTGYTGVTPEQFKAETYVALLLAVAPLMILYIICQKFFTECMDRSGIKG
ncbi:MAG: carbohydrate ABC transporter permease [Lachnospiraceae bacterium]|nr:carbohydrate ABC transporter permease [Lachnospiraceae bacterium]